MIRTRLLMLAFVVLELGLGAAAAQPGPSMATLSCADFRLRQDGAWVAVHPSVIYGPHGPFAVEAGEIFRIQLGGTTNYGVKVAEILDSRCR
ncbi:hypothetical protein [Methylocystis heyeri]|uniref:Uncharacterized protein n=1 Tax=Methylocystis heyeri TaxID=391905 RepID=A0A6B8KJJ2_9HYPH|nr:hypothetical protein [Methylocystis heyeri]QGM47095.1 hypothetical protein H2LOC_016135 [Methylocystis heyeri]